MDLLIGNNGPYTGASVETCGYMKPTPEQRANQREVERMESTTRGKVLVQYDNNQVHDPPKPMQRAIWRVLSEDQIFEDEWAATDAQKGACALTSGNQKREVSPGLIAIYSLTVRSQHIARFPELEGFCITLELGRKE